MKSGYVYKSSDFCTHRLTLAKCAALLTQGRGIWEAGEGEIADKLTGSTNVLLRESRIASGRLNVDVTQLFLHDTALLHRLRREPPGAVRRHGGETVNRDGQGDILRGHSDSHDDRAIRRIDAGVLPRQSIPRRAARYHMARDRTALPRVRLAHEQQDAANSQAVDPSRSRAGATRAGPSTLSSAAVATCPPSFRGRSRRKPRCPRRTPPASAARIQAPESPH